jgi:3-(3-hydroxy-phenyl)propionate hydroxylase
MRDLSGITMEDLGFTERWLVIDIRSEKLLDTWDGVEQICDPARAATFMQVTGHRYRWEFQLHDGDDEAGMTTPDALGRLLEPWTGRRDLDGLEIIRNATYTFRARLASRFQAGRIFLLGDAAHLTPPFIGQGLAAGLRDADNLAWKIAHVLAGQAGEDLLATYDTERRPHARAMIKKAIRIGWAMTGGQDRAAAVRRIALAAAVRSDRACEAIASTATPRLKTGALQQRPPLLRPRTPATVRPGGLIANPLVSIRADVPTDDRASAGEGTPVRLDAVLRGRTAVLTAGQPSAELVDLCRRHRLLLVKVSDAAGSAPGAAAGAPAGGWAEVCLDDGGGGACFQALTRGPGLTIIVRPDRVIAAVATRGRLPRLPWSVPAAPVPRASQMIPRLST